MSDIAEPCVFCAISRGEAPASIVCENNLAMAFADLRQFHAGHAVVIPRRHIHDIRELDHSTGAALMSMVSRVTRAVGNTFPNQGLSVWHSIGEAADQEVPHLHIHVHPRIKGDDMLRVYPESLYDSDRCELEAIASVLRMNLD